MSALDVKKKKADIYYYLGFCRFVQYWRSCLVIGWPKQPTKLTMQGANLHWSLQCAFLSVLNQNYNLSWSFVFSLPKPKNMWDTGFEHHSLMSEPCWYTPCHSPQPSSYFFAVQECQTSWIGNMLPLVYIVSYNLFIVIDRDCTNSGWF